MVYLLVGLFSMLLPSQAATSKGDISAQYGCRMHYLDGPLKYSNFTIRFLKREAHHLIGTRLSSTSYTFEVLNEKGRKIGGFEFTMSGVYENTCDFMVGGKKYVVEMFYSTGHSLKAGGKSVECYGSLTDNEIIVWNEATAKRGNPEALQSSGNK